ARRAHRGRPAGHPLRLLDPARAASGLADGALTAGQPAMPSIAAEYGGLHPPYPTRAPHPSSRITVRRVKPAMPIPATAPTTTNRSATRTAPAPPPDAATPCPAHGDGDTPPGRRAPANTRAPSHPADRKSTRLNSSHVKISYAV